LQDFELTYQKLSTTYRYLSMTQRKIKKCKSADISNIEDIFVGGEKVFHVVYDRTINTGMSLKTPTNDI